MLFDARKKRCHGTHNVRRLEGAPNGELAVDLVDVDLDFDLVDVDLDVDLVDVDLDVAPFC